MRGLKSKRWRLSGACKSYCGALALLCFLSGGMIQASAQVRSADPAERPVVTVDEVVVPISGDTLMLRGASARSDTSGREAATSTKRSTGTAMLLSAILPGAGQFYNRSYWKVPIVVGLGLYFVSSWLDNNRRAIDNRDKYSSTGEARWLLQRDFYKSQRDSFTWYFVVLYLLNIADAYVDAALSDFNVTPELSLRSHPAPGGLLTLRVRF
jgi:hypothetical protein